MSGSGSSGKVSFRKDPPGYLRRDPSSEAMAIKNNPPCADCLPESRYCPHSCFKGVETCLTDRKSQGSIYFKSATSVTQTLSFHSNPDSKPVSLCLLPLTPFPFYLLNVMLYHIVCLNMYSDPGCFEGHFQIKCIIIIMIKYRGKCCFLGPPPSSIPLSRKAGVKKVVPRAVLFPARAGIHPLFHKGHVVLLHQNNF